MNTQSWIIALVALAGLITLEKLFAIRKNINTYSVVDLVSNLSCGLLERMASIFWYAVFYSAAIFIFSNVVIYQIPANPFTWLFCLLTVDLLAYWHHRLCHEINILWAVHIVHHQSEDLNISTVFRVSFLAVITRSLFFIWAVVIGFNPEMVLACILFLGVFQFVTHSRVIGKLGVLEKIFSTPSNHRVHHARNEHYINRNYGHIFMFWDFMFKTYTPEIEEPDYGITTGIAREDAYYSNYAYLEDLFIRARRTKRFRDKIKLFFAKPEWTPKEVGFLPSQFRTNESGERIMHQGKVQTSFGIYLIASCVITLALFVSLVYFVGDQKTVSYAQLFANYHFMLVVVLVLYSIFSIGRLLDNKKDARIYDGIRLVLLVICVPLIFNASAYSFMVSFLAAGMLIWLFRSGSLFRVRHA